MGMMQKIYPHLTVEIPVEIFFRDLYDQYEDAFAVQRLAIVQQISAREDSFGQWLIDHGYQYGRDYQRTIDGYRFSNEALAAMFVLGAQQ